MKILLYSSVFYPSTGGVETITATLAENITKLGYECVVITETALGEKQEKAYPYQVVRQPSWQQRWEITKQFDLVHSNGSSVAMYLWALLSRKPFIWTHNGYQLCCVDGLGWVDGEATPMEPWQSLQFYFNKNGLIFFLKEAIKLTFRRFVAYQADLNIACTHWVAKRQNLPNQVVAYTPYCLDNFKNLPTPEQYLYDFIFVGRLVQEKGIDDLINAFRLLVSQPRYQNLNLAIVGDGNLKYKLKNMAAELGIEKQVLFLGAKHGEELRKVISQSKIAVVPSVWEEPMGGVALELLTAQKNLIVSESGGHAECVGEAALKFPNGDVEALKECMLKLLSEPDLAETQRSIAATRVKEFDEVKLTRKYIDIYKNVCKINSQLPEKKLTANG